MDIDEESYDSDIDEEEDLQRHYLNLIACFKAWILATEDETAILEMAGTELNAINNIMPDFIDTKELDEVIRYWLIQVVRDSDPEFMEEDNLDKIPSGCETVINNRKSEIMMSIDRSVMNDFPSELEVSVAEPGVAGVCTSCGCFEWYCDIYRYLARYINYYKLIEPSRKKHDIGVIIVVHSVLGINYVHLFRLILADSVTTRTNYTGTVVDPQRGPTLCYVEVIPSSTRAPNDGQWKTWSMVLVTLAVPDAYTIRTVMRSFTGTDVRDLVTRSMINRAIDIAVHEQIALTAHRCDTLLVYVGDTSVRLDVVKSTGVGGELAVTVTFGDEYKQHRTIEYTYPKRLKGAILVS